ncbi:hypothetical protein DQM28_03760 [Leptospira mayottensis]|uniref:Uncharacterized protein n=1 Tax=Leptospira mayottensis TaxID=1137606 RepID=A0ABN5NPG7_9LEPT|nr:hypothetical protein DQM28_03760 [Leptospira mayottensis]
MKTKNVFYIRTLIVSYASLSRFCRVLIRRKKVWNYLGSEFSFCVDFARLDFCKWRSAVLCFTL